ncbi:hypothetical protein ACGLHS_10080 [Variovorax sp. VaC1]|uniref:hypothetical protein n=1 Tax=Variovorax sp. VaC1 TaxID=3373132 RepID=UPI0037483FD5
MAPDTAWPRVKSLRFDAHAGEAGTPPCAMPEAGTFLYLFKIPILLDETRHRYVPVIGVFRRMPPDRLDQWVMRPDGRPRTDHELASEVLVALHRPLGTAGKAAPGQFNVSKLIEFDRAAAIVVATFLAELPREATRDEGVELARVA